MYKEENNIIENLRSLNKPICIFCKYYSHNLMKICREKRIDSETETFDNVLGHKKITYYSYDYMSEKNEHGNCKSFKLKWYYKLFKLFLGK